MESNLIKYSQWPFESVLDNFLVVLIKYHNVERRACFDLHSPRDTIHNGIADRTVCRLGMTTVRQFLFTPGPQSRRKGTANGHRLQSLRASPSDHILPIRFYLPSFHNTHEWHYQLGPRVQIFKKVGDISYLIYNRSRFFK